MFQKIDTDDSGTISLAEFKEAMQGFSMFGADVDALFLKYDKDGNGSLSIAEFAGMLYNNPSAMRFSMDSGRDSREALKVPPSPKRQAMGEAPPTAVMAAQAGKDLYLEKPLGHNIREGQAIQKAVKENNIVLHVRSSFSNEEGTRVREVNEMELNRPVTGIAVKKDEISSLFKEEYINEKIFTLPIDYYHSNVIARSSKTMNECRNIRTKLKKTGTEG